MTDEVYSALACRGGRWFNAFDEEDAEHCWRVLSRLRAPALIRYRLHSGALRVVLFDTGVNGEVVRKVITEVAL